ncbi:MAG: short-chain dehydrogenase [Rickettsiales bacterium]|nr:short-chain dehydrogenase [Rickettsiales bacterium]
MAIAEHIIITGASSGLGAALAKAYAGHGIVLGLTGRNEPRLSEVAETCRANGAEVHTCTIDVRDDEALHDWMVAFDAQHPVDLVIANAGISGGTSGQTESAHQTKQLLDVNIRGVANTVLPLVEAMKERGKGQLAIMSSVASFVAYPGAPAYCASKAAVRVWGEALGGSLAKHNIIVSVICPGYIRTPMTDKNDFPMPLLLEAEEAAFRIKNALEEEKLRIAFPLGLYWMAQLAMCIPRPLRNYIFTRMPAKTPIDECQ